jgi:FtsH-binding integral membrane protein
MRMVKINMLNTLVAIFLLILLNVQIIAEIPVFDISYIWISVFGMLICLLGLLKEDRFYSYLGGILHFILIVSCMGMILFGIDINYKP